MEFELSHAWGTRGWDRPSFFVVCQASPGRKARQTTKNDRLSHRFPAPIPRELGRLIFLNSAA